MIALDSCLRWDVVFLPVPVGELHHHIETGQYKDKVEERVTISCALGIIIDDNLSSMVSGIVSCVK